MLNRPNPMDLSFLRSENCWWQCLVDYKKEQLRIMVAVDDMED